MLIAGRAGLRRRDLRYDRGQQGQILVLFVAFFSIALAMAAFAIDQGLFLGQRRVSQKDADQAALAGALQLVTDQNPAGARSAAATMVAANEPAGRAEIVAAATVTNSCVSVAVKFETSGLFLRSVGADAPDNIGARAQACVGVAQAPPNVVPFVISSDGPCFDGSGSPIFGATCKIKIRNQDGSSPPILNLEASNDGCSAKQDGDITRQVASGTLGACLASTSAACAGSQWNDCVAVRGGNADDVLQGLQTRLARRNNCGGTDLGGAAYRIPGSAPGALYQPADCDSTTPGVQISPRLVTLAVLEDDPPSGNSVQRISAFAAFYIDGCGADVGSLDPGCNTGGNNCNGNNCNGNNCGGGGNGGPGGGGNGGNGNCNGNCGGGGGGGGGPGGGGGGGGNGGGPGGGGGGPGANNGNNDCTQFLFGRLLKLVLAGHAAGPANNATTVFSVSLRD